MKQAEVITAVAKYDPAELFERIRQRYIEHSPKINQLTLEPITTLPTAAEARLNIGRVL